MIIHSKRETQDIKKVLDSTNQISYENQLIDFITQVCCNYYQVSFEEICRKQRTKELVKVRQIIIYLLYKNSKMSLLKIGNIFGKDHATVLYSKRVIAGYLQYDKILKKEMSELQNVITLKASSFANNESLEKEFYFIDLNDYFSLRISKHKAIILSGYSEDEVNEFTKHNNLQITVRRHMNKGAYILEKANINSDEQNETESEKTQ